ncbi:MAG: MFS transporter [Anaerolineales bacterium]|nr:MFS transporter [Anaerolineales bacterium]
MRERYLRPLGQSLHAFAGRASRFLADQSAGGSWSYQLPPPARWNLRWFWLDGLFASASDSIITSYLALFILVLGGTRAQVGALSSLENLGAALLLLPSAALIERLGRHRQVVVFTSAIARTMLMLVALLPLAVAGPTAVLLAIGLAVVRTVFVNLSIPAWTPLTADLVPLRWRGRYFASRNIIMVAAGMISTLLVGQIISALPEPGGYQIALGLAFLIGMAATYTFARIQEPAAVAVTTDSQADRAEPSDGQPRAREPRLSLLTELRRYPRFVVFTAASAVWNFGLNIGGPFFNVYLVEGLGAQAGTVGILSVISSLAALPGHRLLGPLVDRWGARRVQMLTGLLIPIMPLAWLLVRSPWQVVPINLLGGFLWAGYGVSTFSLQLLLTPEEHRPRYTALYQVIILGALAAGAAVGSAIATHWGYRAVFIGTAVGRLAGALVRFIRLPDPLADAANQKEW